MAAHRSDAVPGAPGREIAREQIVRPPASFPLPPTGVNGKYLPLLDRGGTGFEGFGLEAVERLDALRDARIYGGSGDTQDGVDVYGTRHDGTRAVYQMRCRDERLTAAKLRKAVRDYFDQDEPPFDACHFELCWAGDVNDVAVDKELAALRAAYPGRTISLRDRRKFTSDLIQHRDVTLRWFGEHVVAAVYGAHPHAPTLIAAQDTDAFLRGPLEGMYLTQRVNAAERLRNTSPREAAAMLRDIAQRLAAKGFAPHAAQYLTEARSLLLAASDVAAVYEECLVSLEHHIDSGHASSSSPDLNLMLSARSVLTAGQLRAPFARHAASAPSSPSPIWAVTDPRIQRSIAFLALDAALDEPGEALTRAAEATELLVMSDGGPTSAAVAALRRLAEIALINADTMVLGRVVRMAQQVLPRLLPAADAVDAEDRVRLRLAVADVTGQYDDLVTEARSGTITPQLSAVVHARYARWLMWLSKPNEANAQWLEAVKGAGLAQLGEDVQDYLWALRGLHASFGNGLTFEVMEYGQRARAVAREGRALFVGSRTETNALQQLRAFQHPIRRFRPGARVVRHALRQQLLESWVRGDLAGEQEAHTNLADFHRTTSEFADALRHAVAAGEVEMAIAAARELGADAAGCLNDPPLAPWAIRAALAAFSVVADIVPADRSGSYVPWILTRLEVAPASGWTDNGIRETAIGALSNLAFALRGDNIAEVTDALTPYLNHLVSQLSMRRAIKTIARMLRANPGHPAPSQALTAAIRDMPEPGHTALLWEAGPALHRLRDVLEVQASDPNQTVRAGAVELLARMQISHPAVNEQAVRAVEEVHQAPTGPRVTTDESGGTTHESSGHFGHALSVEDRDRLADKLIEIASDGFTAEDHRAAAMIAVTDLAPALDEGKRQEVFDKAWLLIGGLAPGDLDLGIFRGRLEDAVFGAVGQLAVRQDQVQRVHALALSRLAKRNGVQGLRHFIDIDPGGTDAIRVLAQHESPAARQMAAVLWSRNPVNRNLGADLAADASSEVRRQLANALGRIGQYDAALRDQLAAQLQADCSAQIRQIVKETMILRADG
ncbi:hypothetical protein [Micromonospora sp. KC721]|uniref:hypothetical protein n=1 Tax=Micromonospora sp. KC721 TaxID=2530380 RepID=UPI0014047FB9|nr:hypothetical protein [Micromonospora sp. KC721]